MTASTEEKALVVRAKQGDNDAIGKLYTIFQSKGIAIARQYVKTSQDAEDMYQDAFLKAMGALDRFDENRPFQSWLDVIIVNTCKDYLGKKRPDNFTDVETSRGAEDGDTSSFADHITTTDTDLLPEEALDRKAVKEIMGEILSELPDKQKEAVVLFYYREMSVRQIAESTGIPENTVKSNLNYARSKTKNAVEAWQKKHGVRLYSSPLAAFILMVYFKTGAGRRYAKRIIGGGATASAGGSATAGGTAASAGGAAAAEGAAAGGTAVSAGAAATATTATTTAAVTGTAVAGTTAAGMGAAKIAAIILTVAAVGGGATFGGVKIAESIRERREETTSVGTVAGDTGDEEQSHAIDEASQEEADYYVAQLEEAIDSGDVERTQELLTEAEEAGVLPDEMLEELQAEATPLPVRRTDNNGNVYEYEYDSMGRMVSETVNRSASDQYTMTVYEYDANGNVLSAKQYYFGDPILGDHLSHEYRYEYDASGRRTAESHIVPGNEMAAEQISRTEYTYDADGLRATGRLVSSTVGGNTQPVDNTETRIEYDKDGHIIREETQFGTTTYEYDEYGTLIKRTSQSTGALNDTSETVYAIEYEFLRNLTPAE